MKIETILDAAIDAHYRYEQSQRYGREPNIGRFYRQYRAFRARILRVNEQRKALIDKLFRVIGDRERIIRERTDQLAAKDARIAKLEDKCFYLKRELEEQKRVWEAR